MLKVHPSKTLVCALFLVGTATLTGCRHSKVGQLRQELESVQARIKSKYGVEKPVDLVGERIPAKDNGVAMLAAAMRVGRGDNKMFDAEALYLSPRSNRQSPEYLEAERLLKPKFDKLMEASRANCWRTMSDLATPITTNYPELSQARLGVRLLITRARQSASRGDVTAAWSDFTAGYRLAKLLSNSPSIEGVLTQIDCWSMVLRGFEILLPLRDKFPDYQALLESVPDELDWRTALKFEYTSEMAYRETLRRNGVRPILAVLQYVPDTVKEADLVPSEFTRDEWIYTNFIYLGQKWEETLGWANEKGITMDEVRRRWKKTDEHVRSQPDRLRIAGAVFPSLSDVFISLMRFSAQKAATRGLVRVVAFQGKNGRWPNPGEIEVGTDPFMNQPLRVAYGDGACVVYSLDINRQDDGGYDSTGSTSIDTTAVYPPDLRRRRFRNQQAPSTAPQGR
ncbi:MAG: hypothetical protein JST35_07030 [Armatimonadetes bacterium]|nr:hypothetical protein [Armatimonadota bacterium]